MLLVSLPGEHEWNQKASLFSLISNENQYFNFNISNHNTNNCDNVTIGNYRSFYVTIGTDLKLSILICVSELP